MAAALATLSLAGTSVVSAAASSHAATAHIAGYRYSSNTVGYTMTGGVWRFRYLATTLTVPATETRAKSAMIGLGKPLP